MQAARDLPPAAIQALFKADVKTLPAYVGASTVNGNYMLYQIVKVSQPEKVDGDKLKGCSANTARIVAQQDLSAYLADLRAALQDQHQQSGARSERVASKLSDE